MKEIQTSIAQLASSDIEERFLAARALVRYGSDAEAAIPALIEALTDPSLPVRDSVVWALGAIGEAAIEPLANTSGKGELATREQALWALARYTSFAQRKIAIFLEALWDDNTCIRQTAASAISTLGKRIGMKANGSLDLLDDDEQKVLPKLLETLRKIHQDDRLNDPPYTEQALKSIESIR
ncbi:HEAT repeat domain-containing protein [Phormidium sp. LEGE 05292]|uniref:HEAT repeat domain-containing protein n=1 Tax=[Phormidium] sp. LEGE 05292 TaxID=767427 RepID=UPI00187F2C00|nr:HEAT repeat domain-containing protein [Phormidium sp. LEGE 05292]MBE9226335.1 HEAT repeat domain-containing protein [Phormidium sp. LEGE 05292]